MRNINYLNPSLPISDRVEALLEQMTTEEKMAQLRGDYGWSYYSRTESGIELSETALQNLSGSGVGGLYGLLRADPWTGVTVETGLSPKEGAELVNKIQDYIREHTRLGIPAFIIAEAGHGYMALGGTIGPSQLNMSQTNNPKLVGEFMAAAGNEAWAQGNSVAFSPNLDICQDPRWGRTEETFGEDPDLTAELGAAAVAGLQSSGLCAVAKHFIHGTPAGGRNANSASLGPNELHEVFLKPFKSAIAAGVQGVMPAYNEIDGVPCSGSHALLTQLLRNELGFNGVTFSDVGALGLLKDTFGLTQSVAESSAVALNAGLDFETAQTHIYGEPLEDALAQNLVAMETLDEAVRRVLTLKFQLGLFERQVDPRQAEAVMGCAQHKELALQLARESIVLLKNDDKILPLTPHIKSLAVIGPNANSVYNQLGDYTPPQLPGETTTIYQGLKQLLPNAQVSYAMGCSIRGEARPELVREALEIAQNSDVIVAVMGGSSARNFESSSGLQQHEAGAMGIESSSLDSDCGEGMDRSTLGLLGIQLELVQELTKLGKSLIVVLIGGRPFEIEWIREHVPAILWAGYPGQLGGQAVAEILLGKVKPTGKLTLTWPRSVGQLPVHSRQRPAPHSNYIDCDPSPAFPFGHGLSF